MQPVCCSYGSVLKVSISTQMCTFPQGECTNVPGDVSGKCFLTLLTSHQESVNCILWHCSALHTAREWFCSAAILIGWCSMWVFHPTVMAYFTLTPFYTWIKVHCGCFYNPITCSLMQERNVCFTNIPTENVPLHSNTQVSWITALWLALEEVLNVNWLTLNGWTLGVVWKSESKAQSQRPHAPTTEPYSSLLQVHAKGQGIQSHDCNRGVGWSVRATWPSLNWDLWGVSLP